MKKYFTLVISIILILSLSACEQNAMQQILESSASNDLNLNNTDMNDTVDENETKNNDLDYEDREEENSIVIELTPPDGWEPVIGSVLPIQYMKETASLMVKEEMFDSESLDDVVNEAVDIYSGSFDDFKIISESESIIIDERDARKLTFTCTLSGMSMKFLYAYINVGSDTYVITFGDLESTFDDKSADYQTILNDIRFIEE